MLVFYLENKVMWYYGVLGCGLFMRLYVVCVLWVRIFFVVNVMEVVFMMVFVILYLIVIVRLELDVFFVGIWEDEIVVLVLM